MKSFEYGDEKISDKELMIAVPSMMIAVGILSLPSDLASSTVASDGWIPLVAGGLIAVFLSWMFAKLAVRFPNQTFFTYSSLIVTKPVAGILSIFFSVIWLGVAAYEVRRISDVSKQYLFDRTPVEVIALSFLLVVVYAVSNSRIGLLRLNMMFFPIIILIALVVFVFNLGWFKFENLLPVFQTNFQGYVKGLRTGVLSYVGFTIILFYTGLVENPKNVPKKVVIGVIMPIILYIFLFVLCIGVFGKSVTSNLLYPTIELAKGVEVPGGFFERFESIFFVIWIMAIFNTTSMALDIAVMSINSIFKNIKKTKIVLVVSPIVYVTCMFPQNLLEVTAFGSFIGNTALLYSTSVVILLIVIAKIRGVKQNG